MTWSQAKRGAAAFFHLVHKVPVPLSFDCHLPLMKRVSTVSLSTPSIMSPVVMIEASPSFLQIVAEHLVDPDRKYRPAGYHPCNILSPRLVAS